MEIRNNFNFVKTELPKTEVTPEEVNEALPEETAAQNLPTENGFKSYDLGGLDAIVISSKVVEKKETEETKETSKTTKAEKTNKTAKAGDVADATLEKPDDIGDDKENNEYETALPGWAIQGGTVLGSIGMGAGIGYLVGGPWGAAIGATIGAAVSLVGAAIDGIRAAWHKWFHPKDGSHF